MQLKRHPMKTKTCSKFRVLPYKQGSASAKALASALGGKVLKLENSKFIPRAGDVIINWGCTEHQTLFDYELPTFLNYYSDLKKVTNKKFFFEMMIDQGLSEDIPKFWTNKAEIPDEAFPIVCRTVLAGHSGAGIVLASDSDGLVDCSLYVQYVKKEEEYRVHVGRKPEGCVVIAVQKKAKRQDAEEVNWQIRNHQNGFIYKRNDISPPEKVISSAISALEASGLDFGAVDVIWNKKKGKAYVLEINTAPGLEGQTVQDYADFFTGTPSNSVVADMHNGEEIA